MFIYKKHAYPSCNKMQLNMGKKTMQIKQYPHYKQKWNIKRLVQKEVQTWP